ncbi:MAG TPA: zf-HC2 domain-containing protein [Candidatus Polarisedimenticolia bacterium]|nr:zf-HC2 domain-containing protein [Candidatus Polarisedimenticolia bacterium]
MSDRDAIAPLIPWYAAGTLGAAESAEVEAHLASCDDCRGLLALARGFRRLAPQVADPDLFEHVQAQRLAEFAENPSALEPEARRFITTHIRSCSPCAEALEILEDLGSVPAAGSPMGTQATPGSGTLERARRAWEEIWRRLSRSVLRPAPAFAYLAALIVLVVALPLRNADRGVEGEPPPPIPAPAPAPVPSPAPPPRPPFLLLPPPIDLPEEVVFRDGTPAPKPMEVRLPAGTAPVPLVLRTSLGSDDLGDREARYRVTITQGDRTLFEREIAGADFDRRARLTLFLDPSEVAAGIPCRATIVRVKPGDPAHGEEVYRRSFVLVQGPAPIR